jgi:predicted DNA-binding protein
MTEIEEGTDYRQLFKSEFAKNRAGTDKRLKAERIASMTVKQRQARAARKPPKKQVNFRATEETRQLINALAKHLDKSVTDVIEMAVETLAKSLPDFQRGGDARS